jgi:hypothetical protein
MLIFILQMVKCVCAANDGGVCENSLVNAKLFCFRRTVNYSANLRQLNIRVSSVFQLFRNG